MGLHLKFAGTNQGRKLRDCIAGLEMNFRGTGLEGSHFKPEILPSAREEMPQFASPSFSDFTLP